MNLSELDYFHAINRARIAGFENLAQTLLAAYRKQYNQKTK